MRETLDTDRLKALDRAHVWHPFTQMGEWTDPLVIARGEGCYLFDSDGQRYLDGVSSLWVNVHGHRVAEIDQALRDQLDRLAHSTLLGLSNVPSIELAERLVRVSPDGLNKVFYSDNGSTAVEVALKMAFQYHGNTGQTARTRFVYFEGSYHGDTLGAVGVGGIGLFHQIFQPLLMQAYKAPSPIEASSLDGLEALLDAHGDEVAAVIVEPAVQGAVGMRIQPAGWLAEVARLTREAGALLIADEVATGFGRTGKWFAVEHDGVCPDLMAVAKGLSGGYLPVAATLATDAIYEAFLGSYEQSKCFFHGHSYTGNPLACAVSVANIDKMLAEDTVAQAARKGELLGELLAPVAELPMVSEVRRLGLMVGIELMQDPASGTPLPIQTRAGWHVCNEARARGVLIRPLGNVVVLMPPLGMTDEQLRELVSVTAAAIEAVLGETQ